MRTPVSISQTPLRLRTTLLADITRLAAKRGVSRNAWMATALARAVADADGGRADAPVEVPGQEDIFGALAEPEPEVIEVTDGLGTVVQTIEVPPAPDDSASRAAHPTSLGDNDDPAVPWGHIHRPDRSVPPEERYVAGGRQVRWPCAVPGCTADLDWRRG